jgi:hypothetical protein
VRAAVTADAQTGHTGTLWRCGGVACPPGTCDHDGELHRHGSGAGPDYAPPIVHEVLGAAGSPLPGGVRHAMEKLLGHDFADVRVHTGERAASSARAVSANAYTVGRQVVFGPGQFAPDTGAGRQILAHELAHVAQPGAPAGVPGRLRVSRPEEPAERHAALVTQHISGVRTAAPVRSPGVLLRQPTGSGLGDVLLAEANREVIERIKATASYKALSAAGVKLTDDIIAEIQKKSRAEQFHWLSMLKTLFDTPVKSAADITKETQKATVDAAKIEQKRVQAQSVKEKAKPVQDRSVNIEEKASSDPNRKWVKIKGKFGGGTYEVDRTSQTDIVVRAKVFLKKEGTGAQADVDAIKGMEDGIEKAASTKGYTVDLIFVNAPDADTFTVGVDPSRWEVATNWAGGDVVGYAHELHHLMTFELDRYDYTSHATNEAMQIEDRLHWFREELKKPPNFNDPTSIMDSAAHPNHDDACRVAGLDPKTCVPARQKALK